MMLTQRWWQRDVVLNAIGRRLKIFSPPPPSLNAKFSIDSKFNKGGRPRKRNYLRFNEPQELFPVVPPIFLRGGNQAGYAISLALARGWPIADTSYSRCANCHQTSFPFALAAIDPCGRVACDNYPVDSFKINLTGDQRIRDFHRVSSPRLEMYTRGLLRNYIGSI